MNDYFIVISVIQKENNVSSKRSHQHYTSPRNIRLQESIIFIL